MSFTSIVAIIAILAIVAFFLIITRKEEEPEVCDFDFDFNLDKRPPQEENEVSSIASARKAANKNCSYKYSSWGPCINGKQTRTVTSAKPNGCTGTPVLEQVCGTSPEPPSSKVLFIDFDGHTVVGTNWNYIPEIVCAPSGLTLEEQLAILAQIEIDYAPFNVVITSDESVYNAANPNKRMRCIVTESWEWYGQAGGVAYINSFTWGNDTPCFVFSSLLGYNVKKIHEAASHELGHTIGLYHQAKWNEDCIKLSDYNTGCCGEAPIMGVAYSQPVGKWWIGPNSQGCNEIQDDASILAVKLGLK
jgi:hypothetical protein